MSRASPGRCGGSSGLPSSCSERSGSCRADPEPPRCRWTGRSGLRRDAWWLQSISCGRESTDALDSDPAQMFWGTIKNTGLGKKHFWYDDDEQVDTSSSSLRPQSSQTRSKPAGRFGPDTAALPSPRGWTDGTRAHWTERTGETTQVRDREWHRAFNGYVVVNMCVCERRDSQQALRTRTGVRHRKLSRCRSACRGRTPQWTSTTVNTMTWDVGWTWWAVLHFSH